MVILKDRSVLVISGDDRGKTGKVLEVNRRKGYVVIDGVNVKKRHKKKDRDGKNGGIVEFSAPVHISNVRLIDSSGSSASGEAK